MSQPEYQRQLPDDRGVSIVRLIATEFGSSEPIVRQQVSAAATQIEIDGEVWTGDKRFIPRERLLGKTLTVIAPERHWQMKYPETE
jgi:hypothetical protein